MFRKGQSTLEYVMVLTAIVVLLVWFTRSGSTLHNAIGNIFQQSQAIIDGAAAE